MSARSSINTVPIPSYLAALCPSSQACLLSSISSQYWHLLLALGILSSLGSSLLFTPAVTAVAHFFHDRRGLATGIATTAGPVSGVIFPHILQALFVRTGWEWATRSLALLCLVIAVAANFLIRSRIPPAAHASAHPDARILRTEGFAPAVVAILLAQFASFIPLTYVSSYALNAGLSHAFSFGVVAVLNAGSAVGRVAAGWSADRIGPFNANTILTAVTALACFCVWLPFGATKPGIVIFALAFGFASGGHISLAPVSVGRLCKTEDYGRYYGTCYTVVSLAVLMAIPFGGEVVHASRGSYRGLIVATGLLYVGASIAFAIVKVSVGRKVWAAF
ncbi:hypothetical protein VTK56DRAFT_3889 [Thermocarpiscus australiensis]